MTSIWTKLRCHWRWKSRLATNYRNWSCKSRNNNQETKFIDLPLYPVVATCSYYDGLKRLFLSLTILIRNNVECQYQSCYIIRSYYSSSSRRINPVNTSLRVPVVCSSQQSPAVENSVIIVCYFVCILLSFVYHVIVLPPFSLQSYSYNIHGTSPCVNSIPATGYSDMEKLRTPRGAMLSRSFSYKRHSLQIFLHASFINSLPVSTTELKIFSLIV